MCLAVSGKILKIQHHPPGPVRPTGKEHDDGLAEPSHSAEHDQSDGNEHDSLWRVAEVDFGGVRQLVSLACLPEAQEGDQVLVHVGIALSLVE
ncbi:MAG: HypC/HybG/HupF family hydrogenase formation chaperone [Synechococcaceae cyanobacterium]|jgi:hydrogenase expression/formation protein HypC